VVPEAMANLTFLFAAYTLTWLGLGGYLVVLWRKQNRLERRLQELEEETRRDNL
jgi:CcmD family protein